MSLNRKLLNVLMLCEQGGYEKYEISSSMMLISLKAQANSNDREMAGS